MLSDAKWNAIHKANEARRDKCWEQRIIQKELKIEEQLERRKEKLLTKLQNEMRIKQEKLRQKAMEANDGEFKVYFELL